MQDEGTKKHKAETIIEEAEVILLEKLEWKKPELQVLALNDALSGNGSRPDSIHTLRHS